MFKKYDMIEIHFTDVGVKNFEKNKKEAEYIRKIANIFRFDTRYDYSLKYYDFHIVCKRDINNRGFRPSREVISSWIEKGLKKRKVNFKIKNYIFDSSVLFYDESAE